jgi:vacuolar-type H+-ATPase subunit D/Vma8
MTTTEERIRKIECLKAKRDGMLMAMRSIQRELVSVETELAIEIVDATSDGVFEMSKALARGVGCSDGSKKKARDKK